jgi:hypothetical protein
MIIFLDFDGCLHPSPPDNRGYFCHLERFESVLRDFPSVSVVISSSWREVRPADELIEFFSEDIQERIVGFTPVLSHTPDYPRFSEIRTWIAEEDYCGPWIALDDAADEFPFSFPGLVRCNPRVGFDSTVARCLRARLHSMGGERSD